MTLVSRVGSQPAVVVGMFMVVTGMISGFVSNTATAAMMMPIGLQVAALLSNASPTTASPADSPVLRAMVLGIAYAASIGGMATVIGSPPNLVAVSFVQANLADASANPLSFANWMRIGVPIVVVLLPITWLVLVNFACRLPRKADGDPTQLLVQRRQALGSMRWPEYAVLGCFLMAVCLWLTRPWLASWEWNWGGSSVRPLAGLDDSVIAIGAGLLLCLLPAGGPGKGFVLDWHTAAQLPWGTLLLFGGGLSLAAAIEANGVSDYVGAQAKFVAGLPGWLIVLAVAAALVFFGELASNTATAAAAVPILAALAPGLGLHPLQLVLPAALACSCGFMLPVATPPNAIAYASGHVSIRQMIRIGFWLDLVSIVLVSLMGYVLVDWVLLSGTAVAR